MERPEIDRVEQLRGLDADEAARFLFEWGLVGDPDPQIEALSRGFPASGGEYSWRLGPDCKPPRRTRAQYESELCCERIHGKQTPSVRPELEELPSTSHIDNPPQGLMPDRSPIGGDWATEGVRAHLARVTALGGKPVKPYAHDAVVTKAQAAANMGNPFKDVKPTRSTRLRLDEVTRVYNAMAFGREVLGRRMNAHLTIRWSAIDVGEADAPGTLAALLNRAGKWFRDRTADRSFLWAHDMQLPDELLWVYVDEKSATYGFHTHVLLSMDVQQWREFRSWVVKCLAQLAHRERVPHDVAVLRRSYAKHEAAEDDGHWRWLRYVIKQLDPKAVMPSPVCDKVAAARDVFEPRHLRADLVTIVSRLVGVCRRLDVGAQTKAGFVSRLTKGLMPYVDGPYPIPQLEEDRRFLPYESQNEHVRNYPNLNLCYMLSDGNCEVSVSSAHQYFAYQAFWDRLTIAQNELETAVGRRAERKARRQLEVAQYDFNCAEAIINLDVCDLMPDVWFEKEGERRRLPLHRTYNEWQSQLARSKSNASVAHEWLQSMEGIEVYDMRPDSNL